MEWRLFQPETVPEYTTQAFFTKHAWIDPAYQRGHTERIAMVRQFIHDIVHHHPEIATVTDLGCGDGSLLKLMAGIPVRAWGYDLGKDNLNVATGMHHVDARHGDVLAAGLEYGDLIVATELIEHLLDPHAFVAGLPGRYLLLSSPYDENDTHNYHHHAWAWDSDGYRQMVADAGWTPVEQRGCPAGFQALFATRTP